jgi:HD-GYP domain-containing protein (c-di-GMP phosphodiesterase class II)
MPSSLYYFRPFTQPAILRRLANAYRLVPVDRHGKHAPEWKLPAVFIADASKNDMALLEQIAPGSDSWHVVCLLDGEAPLQSKLNDKVFAMLPRRVSAAALKKAVERAFENLRSREESRKTRQELVRVASDLGTLNKIGVALSAERDTDALLELILTKSRDITCCDAGSLYVVEEKADGSKHLVFKLTQSDSHSAPFRQSTLPIDKHSVAGFAAATGQVLNIKDAYRIRNLPFRLNRDFDRKFDYRTKSMLVVPMKNHQDEAIGVLQLINAKKHRAAKLTSLQVVQQEVIPFSKRSQDLAASLASQAAVTVENNLLYRDIQNLFESFVDASVTAIEMRDPTTSGHSKNVANLTVRLAEEVDRTDTGPYKDIRFTREDIREIRYASILHDFGKVGVPEEVLVKAKKLYPLQMDLIRKHFLYIKKALELEGTRKKLDFVLRNGNQNYEELFSQIDAEFQKEFANLEEFLQSILQANEPLLLPDKTSEKLVEIANWTFQDPSGPSESLLTPEEFRLLSIPKGSLDSEERLKIESHVTRSFEFLRQFRWTKELKNIPNIARAHHEKLDGSGYPFRMKADEIPFQSKMMTIADIFDALTAHDRPYKPAVPIERALTIIGQEVKSQLLDPVLFELFVDAKVYEITPDGHN